MDGLGSRADRNTRATGFGDHRQRVVGTPNIPVAEDGNIKLGNQLADAGPIGMPTVIFGGGARVQGDGLAAFLLRDVPGFEERLVFMVDADADFGRDRHVGRVAHLDHALDDLTEQVRLPCSAEPPPRRVTLGTGQPKLRSTWSAMFSSMTIFAACSTIEGLTPYSCSERIFSLGAKRHRRRAFGLRATNARAVIISATYRPSGP